MLLELAPSIFPQILYQLHVILQLPWEDKGVDIWEKHGYFNEAHDWKGHEEIKKPKFTKGIRRSANKSWCYTLNNENKRKHWIAAYLVRHIHPVHWMR